MGVIGPGAVVYGGELRIRQRPRAQSEPMQRLRPDHGKRGQQELTTKQVRIAIIAESFPQKLITDDQGKGESSTAKTRNVRPNRYLASTSCRGRSRNTIATSRITSIVPAREPPAMTVAVSAAVRTDKTTCFCCGTPAPELSGPRAPQKRRSCSDKRRDRLPASHTRKGRPSNTPLRGEHLHDPNQTDDRTGNQHCSQKQLALTIEEVLLPNSTRHAAASQ